MVVRSESNAYDQGKPSKTTLLFHHVTGDTSLLNSRRIADPSHHPPLDGAHATLQPMPED